MNWKDFNIPQIGLAGGTPLWMDRARRIPARRAQNGDRTSGRLRKRTASSEYRYTYACMLAAVAPVRVTPRLRPVGPAVFPTPSYASIRCMTIIRRSSGSYWTKSALCAANHRRTPPSEDRDQDARWGCLRRISAPASSAWYDGRTSIGRRWVNSARGRSSNRRCRAVPPSPDAAACRTRHPGPRLS